jgi:hypothetical protein
VEQEFFCINIYLFAKFFAVFLGVEKTVTPILYVAMEEEILLFDNVPVALEEQELAWAVYLAILESLIALDLCKPE